MDSLPKDTYAPQQWPLIISITDVEKGDQYTFAYDTDHDLHQYKLTKPPEEPAPLFAYPTHELVDPSVVMDEIKAIVARIGGSQVKAAPVYGAPPSERRRSTKSRRRTTNRRRKTHRRRHR